MKQCSKCREIKDETMFGKDKNRMSGLNYYCLECAKKSAKETYQKNILKYRKKNRETSRNNKDQNKVRAKSWRDKNPEKWRAIYERYRSKQVSSPQFRLQNSVRSGIYISLSKGIKNRQHWCNLVGYTLEQLKEHLEKRFTDGMTWDNYGKWHIDHKTPLSAHNFFTPEDIDFKKAWSLENLQPLWAEDNMAKHDKLDKPFQPSLPIAVNY